MDGYEQSLGEFKSEIRSARGFRSSTAILDAVHGSVQQDVQNDSHASGFDPSSSQDAQQSLMRSLGESNEAVAQRDVNLPERIQGPVHKICVNGKCSTPLSLNSAVLVVVSMPLVNRLGTGCQTSLHIARTRMRG